MKMKKCEYKITFADANSDVETETVSGMVYDIYGIHKADDNYKVDHLPTGYEFCWFSYLKQAREFVRLASEANWPVPLEEVTLGNMQEKLKHNIELFQELRWQAGNK